MRGLLNVTAFVAALVIASVAASDSNASKEETITWINANMASWVYNTSYDEANKAVVEDCTLTYTSQVRHLGELLDPHRVEKVHFDRISTLEITGSRGDSSSHDSLSYIEFHDNGPSTECAGNEGDCPVVIHLGRADQEGGEHVDRMLNALHHMVKVCGGEVKEQPF